MSGITIIIIGSIVVLLGIIIIFALGKKGRETVAPTVSPKASIKSTTLDSGLKIEVLKEGSGAQAKYGNTVSVHYTGWLTSGFKFDSSHNRGQPFQFYLGAGKVIKGWEQGVNGMKIKEKRRLTVPPELGYGAQGAGNVIPPNATLIFEVELLAIK